MDEFEAARARYQARAEWAKARGEDVWGAERLSQLAELELQTGDWALAERYIEESCSTVEQMGAGGPVATPLCIRAKIDARRGRIDRARTSLAAIIEESERRGNLWWAAARLSRADGRGARPRPTAL